MFGGLHHVVAVQIPAVRRLAGVLHGFDLRQLGFGSDLVQLRLVQLQLGNLTAALIQGLLVVAFAQRGRFDHAADQLADGFLVQRLGGSVAHAAVHQPPEAQPPGVVGLIILQRAVVAHGGKVFFFAQISFRRFDPGCLGLSQKFLDVILLHKITSFLKSLRKSSR